MARSLITLGIVCLVLGLGQLPGDLRIERKGFTFYFPITSSIVVSLLVTLVVWIFRR